MRRRIMLKLIASSSALLATSEFKPACAAAAERGQTKYKNGHYDDAGVFFSHGVLHAAMPDGSWNLWTRAVAPDDEDFVRLSLQVSSDDAFDTIVYSSPFISQKSASYVVRANFFPDRKDVFYFRFVSAGAELVASRSTERFIQPLSTSPIGKLDPWQTENF